VLDVLALRQEIGNRLIYLLGNHEMPHIYSITLAKPLPLTSILISNYFGLRSLHATRSSITKVITSWWYRPCCRHSRKASIHKLSLSPGI
jgi:hypothetical protein